MPTVRVCIVFRIIFVPHFHKNAQGVLETEMRHKNYPEYEQICLKIVGK